MIVDLRWLRGRDAGRIRQHFRQCVCVVPRLPCETARCVPNVSGAGGRRYMNSMTTAGEAKQEFKDILLMNEEDRESRWRETAVEVTKTDIVTRRRIPPNFVKDVFLPHLERWVWKARTTPPWYLIELIIAYSQMPVINPSLAKILSEIVVLRLEDLNGPEFVKILLPLYRLLPHDLDLFAHLSVELEEHFYELSTLNLIAIVRIYARLPKNEQQTHFLESHVIPRLQSDIARYDTEELSALLLSLASLKAMDVNANVPLLAAIVPQIERRYDETPLLTSIINLNALCRLRVYHRRLVDLLSEDLSNEYKVRNLPSRYIAMALWTFTRYGVRSRILRVFEDLVRDNISSFSAREFARLAQCLPERSLLPLMLAVRLVNGLPKMPRKEFPFFVLGCVRRSLFPTECKSAPPLQFAEELTSTEDEASHRASHYYVLDTEDPHLVEPEPCAEASTSRADRLETDSRDSRLKEPVGGTASATGVAKGESVFASEEPDDAAAFSAAQEEHYREILLAECLQYANTFENEMDAQDITHIGRLLLHTPKQQYAYISNLLPASWETILADVMIMGK